MNVRRLPRPGEVWAFRHRKVVGMRAGRGLVVIDQIPGDGSVVFTYVSSGEPMQRPIEAFVRVYDHHADAIEHVDLLAAEARPR